jgi:hypothetical protein
MVITGWATFWIFLTVFLAVDTWLFTKGYNTLFWQYKTDAEKEIQQVIIDNMRKEKRYE